MEMQYESKIPVFVFPHKIVFKLEDELSHKQVLSLYNPYDYPIKYRMLSTTPGKYLVNSPEGTILSHHRADIVIRYNDVKPENCDVVDKFRVQMFDKLTHKLIGKQDVYASLTSEKSITSTVTPEVDNFQTLASQRTKVSTSVSNQSSTSPSIVVLVIAVICIGGLFLPSESESRNASRFYISIELKLVCSYVLGLVTMVILKTS